MSTITKRPKSRDTTETAIATEAEVQAVIHKGLAAPERNGTSPDTHKEPQVKLRLQDSLLKRVDMAVKTRPFKTPRHRWLIEAIVEKLEREEASN